MAKCSNSTVFRIGPEAKSELNPLISGQNALNSALFGQNALDSPLFGQNTLNSILVGKSTELWCIYQVPFAFRIRITAPDTPRITEPDVYRLTEDD